MGETLWVFGYGSLMWHPGFDFADRQIARLRGYRRTFCMRSIHHRGTADAPGLVLALDRAEPAACDGVAFAVPPEQADETLAYLRERELISAAYLEHEVALALQDGRQVQALAFVVDADHAQYCSGLDLEQQAQIIARARGGRGPNDEYLFNTVAHLAELGVRDDELNWIADRVRAIGRTG